MESKEPSMLEWLKQHLKETPKEELEKEWAKIESMNLEGPTVDEFLENTKTYHIIESLREVILETKSENEILKGWIKQLLIYFDGCTSLNEWRTVAIVKAFRELVKDVPENKDTQEKKEWSNENRDRYYGLRVGDIVQDAFGHIDIDNSEVCGYGFLDNNRVYIKLPNGRVIGWVAEHLKIVKKAEDKNL